MGKRILSIDDEQDILDCIEVILTGENYDVRTSLSPENIFYKIRAFNPHLILIDICIQEYNGLAVCKAIKSNPETKDIPVIIISSHPSIDNAKEKFGATDILLKPFDIDSLIKIVDKYLAARIFSLFGNDRGIK